MRLQVQVLSARSENDVKIVTYECYLPGSDKPLSLEDFAARMRERKIEAKSTGAESPSLPEVFEFHPPTKK